MTTCHIMSRGKVIFSVLATWQSIATSIYASRKRKFTCFVHPRWRDRFSKLLRFYWSVHHLYDSLPSSPCRLHPVPTLHRPPLAPLFLGSVALSVHSRVFPPGHCYAFPGGGEHPASLEQPPPSAGIPEERRGSRLEPTSVEPEWSPDDIKELHGPLCVQ